ncbi:MAG: FGGY-family carbohydrate kinase, partial [Candidatus Dormiibacterota bacterium]
PVVAGSADQPLAALAMGLEEDDRAAVSIGTGGTVLLPCPSGAVRPVTPSVHTLCHVVPGRYLRMCAILSAGVALDWLRESVLAGGGPPPSAEAVDEAAGTVPPGAGGVLFLPHLSGERTPLLDPDCSGALLGLRTEHTAAHLARAVEEGVAFALRAALRACLDGAAPPRSVLLTGGGSRGATWAAIVADVLGLPVEVAPTGEHTAIGAAMLAAVGTDAVEVPPDWASRHLPPARTLLPDPRRGDLYDRLFEVYERADGAVTETAHALRYLRDRPR